MAMSDNTVLNPGAGGDVIAADDIGGVKVQRIKLMLGPDGVNDGDVSADNPMPVVATGGATEAAQVAGNASLSSIDSKLPALAGGKLPVSDPSNLPLPDGAATSAAQLGHDDRMDLMLYFLSAILEKMPTPDNADRMRVNLESSTQTQMGISGISNPSTGALTPINSMPFDLPNMGSSRLYDQVVFS
jgi:hypothetical protein